MIDTAGEVAQLQLPPERAEHAIALREALDGAAVGTPYLRRLEFGLVALFASVSAEAEGHPCPAATYAQHRQLLLTGRSELTPPVWALFVQVIGQRWATATGRCPRCGSAWHGAFAACPSMYLAPSGSGSDRDA